MDTLWQDLQYAIRMLWKNRSFTTVAILTLALGIGANTAIFSIIYGVMLKPLPYKDPEQLFWIQSYNPTNGSLPFVLTVLERYEGWRDRNKSFESLAARRDKNFNITFTEKSERVVGDEVTYNFFDTLGVKPVMGRFFLPEEDKTGYGQVVVLEESLWQERFGRNPNVINTDLVINGIKYTIVGIAPDDDRLLNKFYVPLAVDKSQEILGFHAFQVVGRIKPNVTQAQAQEDLKAIAKLQEQEMPNINLGWTVVVAPMQEVIVRKVRPALILLMASVGLLLLIACANVANLILVRSAVREKEVVVRVALGAGWFRLTQQFFTESILLAGVGGGIGVLLAELLVSVFVKSNLVVLPRAHNISINTSALIFTLLVSSLTGIFLGLIPVFQARKINLSEIMKENGSTLASWKGKSFSNFLVVGEIALSLILLIGSGLLIKSFVKTQQLNPGFRQNGILTMEFFLPATTYKTGELQANFSQQLIEKVKTLPSVEQVAVTTGIPLSIYFKLRFTAEGKPVAINEIPFSDSIDVTPEYFKIMEIALLKGRLFDAQDNLTSKKVVIINQSAAEKLFPGQNPIGKRLTRGVPEEGENIEWNEIVGIVNDVKAQKLSEETRAQLYFPYYQYPGELSGGHSFFVVRTKLEPTLLANSIRKEFAALDKDVPPFNVKLLEQIVAESLTDSRFLMTLLGVFALTALTLASVGIYGVIAYSVTQRTHEFGIRLALGAQSSDIMNMVLKEGLLLASLGVGIGLIGALGLNQLLKTLLFGVTTTDPLTYLLVSSLLMIISLLASYIPAHRATLVDPIVALRRD